jgi:hypothetical protein
MTVKELIQQLQTYDQDLLVVLSKDGEGNGFSPLGQSDGDNNSYVPSSTCRGELYIDKLTPELIEEGYTEDDLPHDPQAVRAVVLWPISSH